MPTGYRIKIDQSWYQKPDNTPIGIDAGGVVVRKEEHDVLIALIKEDNDLDYILPKGHLESGETIEEAARRETTEEAGFTSLKLITKLGVKERLAFSKKEWVITHYYLFVTDQVTVKPTDPYSKNHRVDWFTLNELPEFMWPEQKEIINDNLEKIKKLVK